MKKYSLIILLFPFSALAITPSTATVGSLTDFQNIQITAVTNTVIYAVDVVANDGIANQNSATPTFNLWTNGATGWNSPCANYANLGSVPAETCSAKTNVVFPTVQSGFHVRIYDTSNASCYGAFDDPATNCAGEPYLDITFSGGGGGSSGIGTTTFGTTTQGAINYLNMIGIAGVSILGLMFLEGYLRSRKEVINR